MSKITKLLVIVFLLLQAGCATFEQKKPHYLTWQERHTELNKLNAWQIKGSLGVIYKNKSDIVSFNWQEQRDNYQIELFGPLNIGAATIIGNNDGVTLQASNKKFFQAKTAEKLLYQQFGWKLPVANMRYWIFANPAPHKITTAEFDSYNHLIFLEQQGWLITFTDFTNVNGIDIPSKIRMQNSNLKIKVAIKEVWFK